MPSRMVLLLAGLTAGCAGARSPAAPPAPPAMEDCVLPGERVAGFETLLVAAVGTDAALADAARLGTPVGLSCTGAPRPRLADAWTADSSRSAWTLVVPHAGELAARWRERPDAVAALREAGVTSVVPLDERRLVVSFEQAQAGVPLVFADRALADTVDLGSWPLRLVVSTGRDLRDAIDGPAAVVITGEPAVLEYASARSGWSAHPLPWNRSYLLLAAPDAPRLLPHADPAAFRDSLAREAVPAMARAATPPFWWDTVQHCPRSGKPAADPALAIGYPRDDPVARALAGRIVATAAVPGLVARGLTEDELPSALRRGTMAAFVVAVPRLALVPCREVGGWSDRMTATPLVETRPTALLRAGTPALAVDYDGALRPADLP